VLPLCLWLIGKAFDGIFCTVYTDKAFTTIKLARALASRGIGLVGMVRAARPKSMPRGAQHYWPFRAYAISERDSLGARGLARRAYCELPKAHGRIWQLAAETWLDSRFVTLLSTAWFSATAMTVKRWTAAVQAKVELPCSRQLLRYCKMLGGVDRFNKQLIASHMGMGRCKQRFQRALFLGWLLPAVGVLNVHLWPSAITGALQKEHAYLGYDKWLQLELGEALIRKYIQQAKELEGTPRKRLQTNSTPHFMPRHPGPPAPPAGAHRAAVRPPVGQHRQGSKGAEPPT